MKAAEQKYVTMIKRLYRQADLICKKNKKADRETIIQTLLAFRRSPTKRLQYAILRGKRARIH